MSKLTCPYCGVTISTDDLFCRKCGAKIASITTSKKNKKQMKGRGKDKSLNSYSGFKVYNTKKYDCLEW